jgi:hypothetical protein
MAKSNRIVANLNCLLTFSESACPPDENNPARVIGVRVILLLNFYWGTQ